MCPVCMHCCTLQSRVRMSIEYTQRWSDSCHYCKQNKWDFFSSLSVFFSERDSTGISPAPQPSWPKPWPRSLWTWSTNLFRSWTRNKIQQNAPGEINSVQYVVIYQCTKQKDRRVWSNDLGGCLVFLKHQWGERKWICNKSFCLINDQCLQVIWWRQLEGWKTVVLLQLVSFFFFTKTRLAMNSYSHFCTAARL